MVLKVLLFCELRILAVHLEEPAYAKIFWGLFWYCFFPALNLLLENVCYSLCHCWHEIIVMKYLATIFHSSSSQRYSSFKRIHFSRLLSTCCLYLICGWALVWGGVSSYVLVALFTLKTCMWCDHSYSSARYKSVKCQFCGVSVGGCTIHIQCEIPFYGMIGRIFLTFLYNIE